jgi:hypothetical protein
MVRPSSLEKIASQVAAPPRLTIDTLSAVVEGLRAVTPLATMVENLQLTEEEIFKIVTDLGTWLIHAHGRAPGEITYAAKQAQPTLFQGPATKVVVVPLGFDRRKGRRHDISRSIRAIIVHAPDQAELARYIDRQFPSEIMTLTGRDVCVIWRVATMGLLDALHEGSNSRSWASVMLEAYDLLDVSLTDAHRAARLLCTADKLGLDDLEASLTKLAWLNESRIRRLVSLLDMCREDPSVESMRILERELSLLTQELLARPPWLAATIGQLIQGQVIRLIERNGLGLDPETRKIELEVRRRLATMGLKRDFDLLVPDGVRATLLGFSDVFWDALDARNQGDSEWRLALDDLLENYSEAAV